MCNLLRESTLTKSEPSEFPRDSPDVLGVPGSCWYPPCWGAECFQGVEGGFLAFRAQNVLNLRLPGVFGHLYKMQNIQKNQEDFLEDLWDIRFLFFF